MPISRQQAYPRACFVRTFTNTGPEPGADEQMLGGNVAGVILNRNLANWEYPKRRVDERDQSFAAEATSVPMACQHETDFAPGSAAVDALYAAQADRATGRSFYDLAKQVPQRLLRVAA